MPSNASKKMLEKVTSSQYALLRSLTDAETLDARWLERAVTGIVRDRFALARGFIKAARLLAKDKDPLVRRGAMSRAYYGAYHAARAAFFFIKGYDEGDHDELSKKVDRLVGSQHGVGHVLKELCQFRNEADYSPYPVANAQIPYDPSNFEGIIRDSIRRAEVLIQFFRKCVKGTVRS